MSDEKKFAEIYRQHYDEIRRYLAKKLPGSDSADLAQEVFLRVLRVGEGYRIERTRSFLFRVASNVAVDQIRLRRHQGAHLDIEEVAEPIASEAVNPETILCAQQRLALLQSAVDELPPRCRAAFTLHKFGHRSHGEIAEELGISVNMVEKHIIKALAHCRKRLAELDGDKKDNT